MQLQPPFLSTFTDREKKAIQDLTSYSGIHSLPEIWPLAAEHFRDITALYNPHSKPEVKITYTQLWDQIQRFAIGLQVFGGKQK